MRVSSLDPKKGEAKKSSQDLFSRYGGRLSLNQLNQILSRLPMRSNIEREYIKRVMERFTYSLSPGISREEFEKGLEEMVKNQRDPISPQLVEQIKKHFGL